MWNHIFDVCINSVHLYIENVSSGDDSSLPEQNTAQAGWPTLQGEQFAGRNQINASTAFICEFDGNQQYP